VHGVRLLGWGHCLMRQSRIMAQDGLSGASTGPL
jgi:hypothetical protein